MSTRFIPLGNVTRLDLRPDDVLEKAKEWTDGEGSGVVVLMWDRHGHPYFASSIADGGEILWLLELCKKQLLEMAEEE